MKSKDAKETKDAIRQRLEQMNSSSLRKCVLEIVNQLTEEQQEMAVGVLQNFSETNINNDGIHYKPRMSEELALRRVSEILLDLEKIANQEVYLEANGYEVYGHHRWDREWEWEYYDSMGCGEILEEALNFARECINDRKYQEASDILNKILTIRVWVNNEWDEMGLDLEEFVREGIVKAELKEIALMILYSCYQASEKVERAKKIFSLFGNTVFHDIQMVEVRNIGRERLKDEEVFWEDWIALLLNEDGTLVARLLKEAILFTKGVDGLAVIAKENYAKHPSLFLDAISEYKFNHEYKKMADLGEEAVKLIDKKYVVRSEIALKTAYAKEILGEEREVERLWNEAYLSNSNERNYLRLFAREDLAKEYGLKASKQLLKTERGNKFSRSLVCGLEENILYTDTETINNMKFLQGSFAEVKENCINPEGSLGWSGRYIGTGIRLFLLHLYNKDELGKATKSVSKGIAFSFGFDDEETFWAEFNVWKKYFPMTQTEKDDYVSWLEDIIDQRVRAIVGGGFTRHYKSVAELVIALGEVKVALGEVHGKIILKAKYNEIFPRHRKFKEAMRDFYE